MDNYILALHTYEEVQGKRSTSYVSTLANLGMLYKTLAEGAKGIDREQLIERAEEALQDALALRVDMLGETQHQRWPPSALRSDNS